MKKIMLNLFIKTEETQIVQELSVIQKMMFIVQAMYGHQLHRRQVISMMVSKQEHIWKLWIWTMKRQPSALAFRIWNGNSRLYLSQADIIRKTDMCFFHFPMMMSIQLWEIHLLQLKMVGSVSPKRLLINM